MANEKVYAKGFYGKQPHANAPAFVKGKLSIKRDVAIQWLQEQEGEYVNLNILDGKDGKFNIEVDTWKPNKEGATVAHERERGQTYQQPALPKEEYEDDGSELPF